MKCLNHYHLTTERIYSGCHGDRILTAMMLNVHSLIQCRYIPLCHDVMVTHTHVHAKKEPNGIIAGCHVVQGLLLEERQ